MQVWTFERATKEYETSWGDGETISINDYAA